MTTAIILEMLVGKTCALEGEFFNATPLRPAEAEDIERQRRAFVKRGCHPMGEECFISGKTGRPLAMPICVGSDRCSSRATSPRTSTTAARQCGAPAHHVQPAVEGQRAGRWTADEGDGTDLPRGPRHERHHLRSLHEQLVARSCPCVEPAPTASGRARPTAGSAAPGTGSSNSSSPRPFPGANQPPGHASVCGAHAPTGRDQVRGVPRYQAARVRDHRPPSSRPCPCPLGSRPPSPERANVVR